MIFWTMKITISSIILIFLVHYILIFLKTNLTTPKLKDLVNAPTQKYDAIFNAMNTSPISPMNISPMNNSPMNNSPNNNSPNNTTQIKEETIIDMKNELKQFMKKQFKENTNENNPIHLDNSSSIQYSSY